MKTAVITLNPGIDRIMYLPGPARLGTLNRAERVVVSQGSKGANVAIMLQKFGHDPAYFTFSGGELGPLSEKFTNEYGVDGRFTHAQCGVRLNIKIIDGDGVCTEFNERGGPVTREELDELQNSVLNYAPDLAIINGSLPQGAETDTYRRLIGKLNSAGCYTVLDADGPAMAEGLCARPRLIKPNARELGGIVGCDESEFDNDGQLYAAMREVHSRFGCDVICTLDAHGAAALDGDGIWRVSAAPVTLRGFTGAGDTFLAAYVHSRLLSGEPATQALTLASAAAGAKVELYGTALPDVDRAHELTALINNEKITL